MGKIMEEEGKFILCPRAVIEDRRLTGWQLKILLTLFSYRGKDTNTVYPSRKSIYERCGIQLPHISKATSELVKLGWLVKEGSGGRKTKTVYRLTVPKVTVTESVTVTDSVTPPLTDIVSTPLTETVTRKSITKEDLFEESFNKAWFHYPASRRGDKKQATKKYRELKKRLEDEQIYNAVDNFLKAHEVQKGDDYEYLKQMSTFLNNDLVPWLTKDQHEKGEFDIKDFEKKGMATSSGRYNDRVVVNNMDSGNNYYSRPRIVGEINMVTPRKVTRAGLAALNGEEEILTEWRKINDTWKEDSKIKEMFETKLGREMPA